MSRSAKNGILVVAVLACGLGLSAKPWMLARAERAEAARKIQQAEADERQMVKDKAEEAHLGTELGKEEFLRKQGYRKAGEVPFEP